jgi:cobalt-precorrin-5B (C1)-methyltransferase
MLQRIRAANTTAEAFAAVPGLGLGDLVAQRAWQVAAGVLDCDAALEVVVFDRDAAIVGRASFAPVHAGRSGRKRRT